MFRNVQSLQNNRVVSYLYFHRPRDIHTKFSLSFSVLLTKPYFTRQFSELDMCEVPNSNLNPVIGDPD